ncbi:MAG: hypothetical protein HY315_08360 [Acidobacteria bacterium]|nr:hypothetical protein [Acidobacteriota bacterium]
MQPEERFERIERQIEFLASHQAQLTATVERHSEQIGQLSEQVGQLSGRVGDLGEFLLRTARIVEDLARRTEEGFNRVAQAQQRTDERLNILIAVVERYFSNGKKE